jgi:hypothetical protein
VEDRPPDVSVPPSRLLLRAVVPRRPLAFPGEAGSSATSARESPRTREEQSRIFKQIPKYRTDRRRPATIEIRTTTRSSAAASARGGGEEGIIRRDVATGLRGRYMSPSPLSGEACRVGPYRTTPNSENASSARKPRTGTPPIPEEAQHARGS